MLRRNGFRVDADPLGRRANGELVEKGTDIGLATELVAHGFILCSAYTVVVQVLSVRAESTVRAATTKQTCVSPPGPPHPVQHIGNGR